MYWDEARHNIPHFHADYGDIGASVSILNPTMIEGSLPRRAWKLVHEWALLHADELMANWDRARMHYDIEPIEPLR